MDYIFNRVLNKKTMKEYVKIGLSFVVTGFFLMMAVASVDPETDLSAPKNCEFLIPPVDKITKITMLVKDSETKLPIKGVRIELWLDKYKKTKNDENMCFLKQDDREIFTKFTDENGMWSTSYSKKYYSSEDYIYGGVYVDATGYYDVESDFVIFDGTATFVEPIYLLKINKTP